jgi:hypothetical protein
MEANSRLEQAYKIEKPRLLARVRAAGRSLELRHYMREDRAAMEAAPESE